MFKNSKIPLWPFLWPGAALNHTISQWDISRNRMKTWGGRELILWPQFFGYDGGTGTKMLRRASCSQGSGDGGQRLRVRGQNRGQISRFRVIFILFLDLTNLCTLFRPMTPDPRPLTSNPWLWNALLGGQGSKQWSQVSHIWKKGQNDSKS